MVGLLDTFLRDLRSARRVLAARPGWTGAAILCVAIATGANTAAFTLINGLLLRPLPFDQPEQLVMLALRDAKQGSTRPFSLDEYRALEAHSHRTGSLLARTFFPLSLVAEGGARMAQAELVSGNYFATLRVQPFLGSFFDASADRHAAAPLVVMSHHLWQERFNRDPGVVGRQVRINGRSMTVTGVAPPGFVGAMQLVAADLWLPASIYPSLSGRSNAPAAPMFGVMGRLAPGMTISEAGARLTAVFTAVSEARPGRSTPTQPASVVAITRATGFGVPVSLEGTVLTFSGFVYVLMALLTVVSCANVAALILARATSRRREIALRFSLGASRWHIARQLLTESLVLALAGCAAGTIISIWLTQALVAKLSTPFQYVDYAINVQPDIRVLAYSALEMALTAVICGIAPLRIAGRIDVIEDLKQSGAKGHSRASMRTLNTMVVMQFAVSTMLLVAAGLLVRTYLVTHASRPAFETASIVAATVDVAQLQLKQPAAVRLYQVLTGRLSTLPGVTDVALTRDLPPSPGRSVRVRVHDNSRSEATPAAEIVVSPHFFKTLGLAIQEGRAFTDDEPAHPRVAMINEAMARQLWPDTLPVGRMFTPDEPDAEPMEVVGVVSNSERPSPTRSVPAVFYVPFPHEYAARMTFLLRVPHEPARAFRDIRRAIAEVNPDLSVVDLRALDDRLDQLADQQRMPATMLVLIGVVGLVLSAVGLYGVVAYGVRERVRELGIRLALGARPADIRVLVLREGFSVVGIGLGLGIVLAVAGTRIVRATIFGVETIGPLILSMVAAVLLGVAFVALYLPGRWASRVEPAITLRSE